MKKAASILSWIGGSATIMLELYNFITYFRPVFWIAIIISVPQIGILIYREISVKKGFKVACGILTLIFCSVIGGIFTLCIPEHELYGYDPKERYTPIGYNKESNKTERPKLSSIERASKIDYYKKQLQNGEISIDEYSAKIKELDS